MTDQARINQDMTAEIERLKAQIERIRLPETASTIVASWTTSTAQSIGPNVATIITYDIEARDTHDAVTLSPAWRFVSPLSGDYLVSAAIMYGQTGTWTAGEAADLVVYVNGGAYRTLDFKDNLGSGGSLLYAQLSGSTWVNLPKGSYLDIRSTQQSGTTIALIPSSQFNYVSIWKI